MLIQFLEDINLKHLLKILNIFTAINFLSHFDWFELMCLHFIVGPPMFLTTQFITQHLPTMMSEYYACFCMWSACKMQWCHACKATWLCVVVRRYLLRSRPQLSQAGCQVLGTLTQLHGRGLIFHRGNRWLGRGHHLTTGLQNGKRNAREGLRLNENVFIKKWYFLPGHSGFASKPSVAVWNNKNKALIIC